MKKEDIKKVVLAYSGGLDTSVIIPWLRKTTMAAKLSLLVLTWVKAMSWSRYMTRLSKPALANATFWI